MKQRGTLVCRGSNLRCRFAGGGTRLIMCCSSCSPKRWSGPFIQRPLVATAANFCDWLPPVFRPKLSASGFSDSWRFWIPTWFNWVLFYWLWSSKDCWVSFSSIWFHSSLFIKHLLQSKSCLGALQKPRVWPPKKQQWQGKTSKGKTLSRKRPIWGGTFLLMASWVKREEEERYCSGVSTDIIHANTLCRGRKYKIEQVRGQRAQWWGPWKL